MWLRLALLLVSALAAATVGAQNFPTRPVRNIVPYAAGGAVDTVARTVSSKLSDMWGQTVVIENRPGGAANIGTDLAARAAPDGYTLLMGTTANGVNLHLMSKMSHNFIRDFTPISLVDTFYNILVVNSELPAKSVKELLALARAKPGQLNYGSAGVASSNHFSGELFNLLAGVKIQHVPYKDAGVALSDLIGGRLDMVFPSVAGSLAHLQSGRLRGLGVTGPRRSAAVPQVPTIAEAGVPGYELTPWHALLAPAGTPKPIITKLHADVVKALAAPDIRTKLVSQGIDNIVGSTPDELAQFIKVETAKYEKLVTAAGLKKE